MAFDHTRLSWEWAQVIVATTYGPMPLPGIIHYLKDLTDRLVAALSGPQVDTQAASEVGAQLVAGGFIGPQSLSRTVEYLGTALPGAPTGKASGVPCGRMIELLGALAAGYAWALRDHVLRQQHEVKQALSLARQDIERDLHLLRQRLSHQALHDLQTGLPNRVHFASHLETVLGQLDPSAIVTVLHLDLDGFSAINDGLGHHAGDRLLNVVARRLENAVSDQRAMVARLGADEYAIFIEPGQPVPNVGALAELINTELAEPFYLDRIGIAVTATIGAVQRGAGEFTAQELMRAAGATLRRLGGRGTRQWDLFDPDIDAAERTELQLAAAMPGALESGELQVTYQPVVTLDRRTLVGIEAALSWPHPQHGVLSNDQCVQAAERTGVAHAVGQWLLRTAAEQAVSWRQRSGDEVPPVVVNLTPSQAQDPDLVTRVRAVLAQTGLAPAQLELRAPANVIRTASGELAGEGGGHAEDNLRVLADLGVRAGLYDFGGGIGELRCLADLPVCTVRIARPVSEQVAADPSRILSQAAQALVHIVRAAGVDVVAFPVDSEEQAACWPWIGANWAVGALFGGVEQWLDP
ncbi:MAG: putative bifunctional diguanylate cyclase/phosphodiesterase [Pseudonocardiaceae bacterium]